ncbi:helix-turn-helix transcriptional regulator [Nocardia aurantiaca]|uniref:WYL domain-containing protein n=1 Tax=Nocardia aurantiaca TaxID=2675850 RepID=A0A6I3KYS1_9NOCA|nr:WYL domain-containing protein [Nocardia aurantiaca]
MTRPTVRVLALLELLQSGGTRTMTELAEHLGVDTRTVRRYIDHLIDLEVPVEAVRGRYGGYRLTPGFRLPPLMFSDDEALVVLLGLIAGQRTGLTAAAATANETAAAKIRRVLPARLADRLTSVLESVSFTEPPGRSEAPEAAVLLAVTDAVHHHRPLSIRYTDRHGRPTRRIVHPHGVIAHAGRWYVTATDPDLAQGRTFRLDRITDARTLPGSFEPAADSDPAQSLLTGFATAPYRHEVIVRIHATLDHIRHQLPASIAVLEDLEPHRAPDPATERWYRVEIRAERLDWLPSILAALDRPFTIDRPTELRSLVTEFADRFTTRAHHA